MTGLELFFLIIAANVAMIFVPRKPTPQELDKWYWEIELWDRRVARPEGLAIFEVTNEEATWINSDDGTYMVLPRKEK